MRSILAVLLILPAVVSAAEGDPEKILDAISPYEPVYFLLRPNPLAAKFQISLAIRLFGEPMDKLDYGERRDGLYTSFSQTSLWDLEGDSKPFYDSSYRPEVWYHQSLPSGPLTHFGVEGGGGHESNGRDGDLSRSFNHLFIRPVGRMDFTNGWHVGFHPRARVYVTSLEENPDIARYRGNFDLEAEIGQDDQFQLAAIGRIGNAMDRGSIQLDATYPLTVPTHGWANFDLHLQVFHGYGESLRAYDEKVTHVLAGISFVR